MGGLSSRTLFLAVAVAVCLLFGSSRHVNTLARKVLSRPSISFTSFTLDLTPQQFYGRMMSRTTIKNFFPFASAPEFGPHGFGPGAIALPIWPLGFYILHDINWEYSGSVFTSTPAALHYKACFTHRRKVSKAIAEERCLVTLDETVEIEPVDESKVRVRRTISNMVVTSPIAGILANLLPVHMELHHHLALKRDWKAVA